MNILEIGKWNYLRNGLEYNPELEQDMLDEEAKEFSDAFKAYLHLITSDSYYSEDTLINEVVDMVDAYCDYMYVYTGTVLKAIGFKPIDGSHTQSVMYSVLTEVLLAHGARMYEGEAKLTLIEEAFQYVIEANGKKPLTKTKGKVAKGKDFIDPKVLIKELLQARGFVARAPKEVDIDDWMEE